jgi:cytochrome c oxidase subunit III
MIAAPAPTPAASRAPATVPATTSRRREIDAQVGLVIFLGATAMLFAALLLAYAIIRTQAPSWPPAGAPPFPRGAAAANTLALIAASLALRRGRPRVALALGAAFLAAQALLWHHLVFVHLGPSAGALGEVFFALSALHALHVLGGLVALALGSRRTARPARLRLHTLYWDFVLAVWIVVYVAVCLL